MTDDRVPTYLYVTSRGTRTCTSSDKSAVTSTTDMTTPTPTASEDLLTPANCAFTFIDHQPQMALGVNSIDGEQLRNNVAGLAKTGRAFDVPVVLSTISEGLDGPLFDEIQDVFPEHDHIDRTTMNAWEDEGYVSAIEETDRDRLVMAGLWTEVCITFPALSAIEEGYDIYVVTDASGGVSDAAHEGAIQRMVAAGATPVTWLQVLYELQRDWADDGAGETIQITKDHGGEYATAVDYSDFLRE